MLFAVAAQVAVAATAPAMASSAAPPSDPAVVALPALAPGDTWVFDRAVDRLRGGFAQTRIDLTIDRVDSATMLVGIKPDGAPTGFEDHRLGRDWSQRLIVNGQEEIINGPFAFPMKIVESWTEDHVDPQTYGLQTLARFHSTFTVVGWESVTVPAGTFRALKIEKTGTLEATVSAPASAASAAVATPNGAATMARTERARVSVNHFTTYGAFYYVPDVKYYVKSIEEQYDSRSVRVRRDTDVLVSFKPGA
jgi:hypothetical protein